MGHKVIFARLQRSSPKKISPLITRIARMPSTALPGTRTMKSTGVPAALGSAYLRASKPTSSHKKNKGSSTAGSARADDGAEQHQREKQHDGDCCAGERKHHCPLTVQESVVPLQGNAARAPGAPPRLGRTLQSRRRSCERVLPSTISPIATRDLASL
jgi:hypothetical protein